MLETINQANFADKVLKTGKPVLLSYLHRDHDYLEHLANLSALSEKFQGKVKMYVLGNESSFVCRKLCILGDPTFIAFKNGKETGRLLGKVLVDDLAALCNRMLQETNEHREEEPR